MIVNDKLRAKRDSLFLLSEKLGIHVDEIPFMYPDQVFDKSLTRKLAQQALNLTVDDFHSERLDKLCDIRFNRDARTAAEYAIDLIYGWFVEDLVLEYLQLKGFKVKKQGVDKDREFLPNSKIKSDIDLEVFVGKASRLFDVYFDSQGYWQKNNKLDIRESKWKELEKTNSSVLCISNFGFGIIDSSSEHTFGPNPLWGGKNSATIKGIKDKLTDLDQFTKNIKEKIKNNNQL
jgi:hypothetical protein